MTSILIAAFMWALWLTFLLVRRRRARQTVTWAAFTIAVSMTLNLNPVYIAVDQVLGGNNWTDLIGNSALMVGLFFLARGVTYAHTFQNRFGLVALGPATLAVALVVTAVSFLFVDRGSTTVAFMADLGAQPAAAAYSIAQYVYCAIVIAALGISCLHQMSVVSGWTRVAVLTLIVGSGLGAITSGIIIAMDVAHLGGNHGLLQALQAVYAPAYTATIAALCLGLAIAPVARQVASARRWVATNRLLSDMRPLWESAANARPSLTRLGTLSQSVGSAEDRLYRQVVEIRDVAGQQDSSFSLTDSQELLVEAAEKHLLSGASRSATKI